MGFINTLGKYAGSISAIIALLTLILWKPISAWMRARKEKKAKAEATRAIQQREIQDKIINGIELLKDITTQTNETVHNLRVDVADLQCDRLNQAHGYWMKQGYCPTDTKRRLCDWYESYHKKGGNHLSQNFIDDLTQLPDSPEGGKS